MKKIIYLLLLISLYCCTNNDKSIDESILYRNYESMAYNNCEDFNIDSLQILSMYYKENNISDKYCYCNTLMGCYFCGIEEYEKAYKVLKEAENNIESYPELAPTLYYHLFEIFKNINTTIADSYLNETYNYAIIHKDSVYLSLYYFSLSLEKEDSADYYFQKSINLLKNYENTSIYDFITANWIINHKSSADIITNVVPYFNKYKDYNVLKNIISSYIELNNLDSATYYLNILSTYPKDKLNYHILLSEKYKAEKKYDLAYKELCYAKSISDSIVDYKTSSILETWENDYSNKNNIEKERNKFSILLTVIIITLAIIIIILIIKLSRYKRKVTELSSTLSDEKKENTDSTIHYIVTAISKLTLKEDQLIDLGLKLMQSPDCDLSKTELLVLWLLTFNYSNQDIAKILDICNNYVYQIKTMLKGKGVKNVEDAKNLCIEYIIKKGRLS